MLTPFQQAAMNSKEIQAEYGNRMLFFLYNIFQTWYHIIWFGCKEKGVYEFAIQATHTEDI